MSEVINNTPQKKKKKKTLTLLLMLLLVFIMVTGVLAAFFSDYIFRQTDLTAGTLKINGTYSFFLNGQAATDTVADFKPGDAMVVRTTITNTGSLSAWVRDNVSVTIDNQALLDNIEIYRGEYSQVQLAAGGLQDNLVTLTDGKGFGDIRVINGTGDDAQTESGGDYDYVGASSYQDAYTIYFLPTAGNEAQAQTFAVSVATQALQFRNNSTIEPNNDAWATVTAAD